MPGKPPLRIQRSMRRGWEASRRIADIFKKIEAERVTQQPETTDGGNSENAREE